jgi:hypothetical protein
VFLPEGATDGFVWAGVLEGEVDAGFYGLVEDGDAVGGEEYYALEVFELAEEYWRELEKDGPGGRGCYLLPWRFALVHRRGRSCALRGIRQLRR